MVVVLLANRKPPQLESKERRCPERSLGAGALAHTTVAAIDTPNPMK